MANTGLKHIGSSHADNGKLRHVAPLPLGYGVPKEPLEFSRKPWKPGLVEKGNIKVVITLVTVREGSDPAPITITRHVNADSIPKRWDKGSQFGYRAKTVWEVVVIGTCGGVA